jgi:hypothetical protein
MAMVRINVWRACSLFVLVASREQFLSPAKHPVRMHQIQRAACTRMKPAATITARKKPGA